MAITKTIVPITWPTAAADLIVLANDSGESEAITIADDEVSGEFILSAASGATNTGHQVDFYLMGSVDGVNFTDAADTALFLGSLTMLAISTTYRSKPINLPLGLTKYKIFAVNNLAAGDSVLVSAKLTALNLE